MIRSYTGSAVVIVAGLISLCFGCSPIEGEYRPPTLDWKLKNSDVVGHGVILSRENDPRFPGDMVYSVGFQLRCIYKGAPLEESIRINQVGSVPGHCLSTNLAVNEKYLVYLRRRDDGSFVQEFSPDPGNMEYLDEVMGLCAASVNYPTGYDASNNKETCPELLEGNDCFPEPADTTSPPKENENDKSPPSPEEAGQPEEPKPEGPKNEGKEVPYEPVASADQESGGNGSVTLTLHASALICLVASLFLL